MLTVTDVGSLSDQLHRVYLRTMAISRAHRDKAIAKLVGESKHSEAIALLKKSKHFELKFDRISPVKIPQYKELIQVFLSAPSHRFAAMVIDRTSPGYDDSFFKTTWDAYTSYLATLVSREITNLAGEEMFLVLDELPKPNTVTTSLEQTVMEKIEKQRARRYGDKPCAVIKNCLRIESHSNLAMQLCDVLLGAVMFDYKRNAGALSEKLKMKKEGVVDHLRKGIGVTDLSREFTVHHPVYFHVWNAVWK